MTAVTAMAMVDAPMMALMMMLWLLAAGLAVVGVVALVRWVWRRTRP